MIKFLVLIAIVFAVIWLMRGGRTALRGRDETGRTSAPPPPAAPQDMVECPVCHVHLPRIDALAGPGGQLYCCAEHRERGG